MIKIIIFICFFVIGCGYSQPPLEYSPDPNIIEKAIQIELQHKYQRISQQLDTKPPEFTIKKINITKIQPTIKFELPTYHLEGNCQIWQKNSKSKKKKIKHNFQIDLQRQSAGKTWRILIKNKNYSHKQNTYYSYKV